MRDKTLFAVLTVLALGSICDATEFVTPMKHPEDVESHPFDMDFIGAKTSMNAMTESQLQEGMMAETTAHIMLLAARETIHSLNKAGQDDSACKSLAKSTIDEIEANRNMQEKMLTAIKGTKCEASGDAEVASARAQVQTLQSAYDAAKKKVDEAGKSNVHLKLSLKQVRAMKKEVTDTGKCSFDAKHMRGHKGYQLSKSQMAAAQQKAEMAQGALEEQKKLLDSVKKLAAKEKLHCRCRHREKVESAWKIVHSKLGDQKDAYHKARMMLCVLNSVDAKSKECNEPFKPLVKPKVIAAAKCANLNSGGFKFGTLGQVACPKGYSRIYDEATCKSAMKAVTGKSVASVGKHCWKKHPRGCFTHYGKNKSTRILVNNNGCGKTSGTTYSDSQSICTGGASKAPLKCAVSTKSSNSAGVVKPAAKTGTLVGGGMNNHYRSWDGKAGFEQSYPDGNHYSCDMGFGPGRLTCYGVYCSSGGTGLDCTTRSTRFHGSGAREAKLPSGYTMTGGGLFNHYRHFNAKAGFEDSRPKGNSWYGDMGFGSGDYTVYVRGCKGLTCTTVTGKRGNSAVTNCPSGYTVTGCGTTNHHRKWDKKSGFEQANPHGNGCHCDAGFGAGDQTCYARCCKMA